MDSNYGSSEKNIAKELHFLVSVLKLLTIYDTISFTFRGYIYK